MAAFSTYKPTVGLVDYPVKDAGLCDELDARFPGANSGWAAPGALGSGTRNTGAFSFLGVGEPSSTTEALRVLNANLTSATQLGVYSGITGSSAGTSRVAGFYSALNTAAASYTCAEVDGLFVANAGKGAGSTITLQVGVSVGDLTSGNSNYGFRGQVSDGANRFNCYIDGTAPSGFAGKVQIGSFTEVSSNYKFELQTSGATARAGYLKNDAGASGAVADFHNTATSGDNVFQFFYTEGGAGTARGYIDYNRPASQVRYSVSCDANLKEDLGPVPDVGPFLDAVAGTMHLARWKETGINAVVPFAQELYREAPFAVSRGRGRPGDYDYRPWGVDCGPLVPYLITEVASLRARVAQLEGA